MNIVSPAPGLPTVTLTTPPVPSWRVGQFVDARVAALTGLGKVTLQVGSAIVEAHTSLAVTSGQQLHLEVMRSDSQVVLRITPPTSEPATLTAALREALPHQQPLQNVFSHFTALLSSPSGLSPTATTLLKQLIGLLPDEQTISRIDGLKQAMMDSGLFLEQKLGSDRKPDSWSSDLKANLLRLLAETSHSRDEPAKTLTHHIEAGLARIQLHQLSSLADAQSPITAWAGELPVRNKDQVDVFQFRIEKDAKTTNNPEQETWCTWLSFNIKALGPMHAKISMTNQNVAAILWAESNLTVNLINQNLNLLHQSLEVLGLEIKDLHCFQGSPPLPKTKHLPKGLLDLMA